ncbi:MAG: hypothetical protein KC729_16130 [Candidatus Eisenbacteria bacterium]|uniref:Uncharacterized protein n=1 Tax=Eiseniibacteriota bacterium TaxID=2212470 RepID=A0A956M3K7_UNCEI|nr:hypothetical protein [Candidatus Eisenbacteria bacterium]
MAAILAIPTGLVGGADAVVMMAIGAGVGLATVVAGYYVARFAFRGPDRFATKLVVGGFMVRMVLLFGAMAALMAATDLDPSRFVLWLVTFYFVLILVEAFLFARSGTRDAAGSSAETDLKAPLGAQPREGAAR